MIFLHTPADDLPEETDADDTSLPDDVLTAMDDDSSDTDDAVVEGFGEIEEDGAKDESGAETATESEDDENTSLEDDAEEVDFDTFDDIDEL